MAGSVDSESALAAVNEGYVLELEQASLRIPSPVFEEHELVDYLAGRMSELGLEVDVMEVEHPTEDKTTRQAIGRLKGSGGGPTLMLNGYADQVAGLYTGMDLVKNF